MYKGETIRALEPQERHELLELVDERGNEMQVLFVRALLHTGMRASELAHAKRGWLRPDSNHAPRIEVPPFEDCDCKDCRQKAEQAAGEDDSVEQVLGRYWKPKSGNGARRIPVANKRTWSLLSGHLERNGELGYDRWKVHYEVTKLNKDGVLDTKVTPHLLRHTYATHAAVNDVGLETLQQAMGHADPKTTAGYIRLVGNQTARKMVEAREDA
jgi:integrase